MTEHTTGAVRPFRFGVLTPVLAGLSAWKDQVRRIADSGYSTLLMPDVPDWQPAPAPTLAVAATVAPKLRVGTWVYASPFRTPRSVAWEAHSLTQVTEGRFEFGIGAGRPGLEDDVRRYGMPVPTPGERLTQIRDAVTALRELDGANVRTPVAMAVRGPKSRTMAAELADTVNFAVVPTDSRADIGAMATEVRAACDAELALHISVIGDAVSHFMAQPDIDTAALHASGSLIALPSDPSAAVEELQRRREEHGFSYAVIGANNAESFAPVVAELAGR